MAGVTTLSGSDPNEVDGVTESGNIGAPTILEIIGDEPEVIELVEPVEIDPGASIVNDYVPKSALGAPGGVATLGTDGQLTVAQRFPTLSANAVREIADAAIEAEDDPYPNPVLVFENGLI